MPALIIFSLLFTVVHSSTSRADIYQWRDEHGQLHYSDDANDGHNAQPTTLGPTTVITPPAITEPAPPPSPAQPSTPADRTTPTAPQSATHWAAEHCTVTTRIFYTERSFIPCVPTDEVSVYLCETPPPSRYRRHFGRQYRYQDRESECGPEVYEGEILYLKP